MTKIKIIHRILSVESISFYLCFDIFFLFFPKDKESKKVEPKKILKPSFLILEKSSPLSLLFYLLVDKYETFLSNLSYLFFYYNDLFLLIQFILIAVKNILSDSSILSLKVLYEFGIYTLIFFLLSIIFYIFLFNMNYFFESGLSIIFFAL